MSDRRVFVMAHAEARRRCADFALNHAPDGYIATFTPALKKRVQEERYHAMIGDIAAQWEFLGQKWHRDDMKRILVDAFAESMRMLGEPVHHDGRVVPSVDGKRVVQLGIQTKDFWVKEASDFIEFLFEFGSQHGIVWSDESRRAREPEAA